jgi:hypothetical protein
MPAAEAIEPEEPPGGPTAAGGIRTVDAEGAVPRWPSERAATVDGSIDQCIGVPKGDEEDGPPMWARWVAVPGRRGGSCATSASGALEEGVRFGAEASSLGKAGGPPTPGMGAGPGEEDTLSAAGDVVSPTVWVAVRSTGDVRLPTVWAAVRSTGAVALSTVRVTV